MSIFISHASKTYIEIIADKAQIVWSPEVKLKITVIRHFHIILNQHQAHPVPQILTIVP